MNRTPLLVSLVFAAPSAWSAGLPSLPTDVRTFLRPAVVEVPRVSGAAVEHPFLARAKAIDARLRKAGHLRADVAFHMNENPDYENASAYVLYDFAKNRCDVFIDEKGMRKNGFEDEFLFRFVMYHELAHCHLYANPKDLKPFPALSDRANRIASDLVHLEYFRTPDGDGPKVNGYSTYHETYADVKAVGILLSESGSDAGVRRIVSFREGAAWSFMDTHDNAAVFPRVLAASWPSDPDRLDAQARAIADPYIVVNFFRKLYRPSVWDYVALSDVLASNLRTPAVELRLTYGDEEVRKSLRERFANAAASPNLTWREYARIVLSGAKEEQLVDAFFRARYGVGVKDLVAEDASLRAALKGD
ncbi:MAG: hypothetical protein HY078_12035 [Elusimicrobia bacterium]|nr:hypothetical protein [Elusimicrobiota bacterium]